MNKEYIDIKLNIFESMYNNEINDIQCDYLIESFDNCNNYNDYKLAIYEAENYNIITEYYRDKLLDTINSVFCEKASKMEYKIRAFKKRYKYDEKEKTIIVNGEKYKCDLDVKSKFIKVKDIRGNIVTTIRSTSAEIHNENPTIFLDENFFKLKNSKRQNAVLQHEIGHVELHSRKNREQECKIKNEFKKMNNEFIDAALKYSNNPKKLNELEKEYNEKEKDYCKKMDIINNNKDTRKKILEKIKNYEKTNIAHTNTKEFEADRYAVNHSSKSDLKKGLQQLIKMDIKKYPKSSKSSIDDYNTRMKVLEDKDLQNSKIYN